jgi:translation initiation factor 4G
VIKTADGAVVDLKNISTTTPAPQTRPPAVVSSGAGVPSTSTPPPRAAASTPQHTRTDSSAAKTVEETKREFNEQFKRQLEKEKAESLKKKEADDKPKPAAEKPVEAEVKEPVPKVEEVKPVEPVEAKGETEEEKAERIRKEEEAEQERWIAELEEQERLEEEREKAYAAKKAEEKARKEAEAAAKLDEDLKRAEREAEALEEAKLKGKTEGEEAGDKAESDKLFATLKRPTFGPGATASTSGTSTPEAMQPPAIPTPVTKTTTFPKQKPAALKLETNKTIEPAQPTAGMQSLRSARMLQLQNESVNYPDGIKSPNPALNQGSKSKGRQYDKNFLMQFQEVFKEKPSVDWDKMLKDTVGDSSDSARPQSARTPSMGGRQASRSGVATGTSFGPMGTFNTGTGVRSLPPGTTSAERFAASQGQPAARPGPAISNPFASFAGRPGGAFPMGTGAPVMARTSSSQSLQQGMNSPRNASSRGRNSRRGPTAQQEAQLAKQMPLTAGADLKPLELSRTGWKPISITGGSSQPLPSGQLAPDLVQRKVKAALNKMTPEKFEKISMDILEIAGQSKNETDGRTLRQVIQLTFEKATDEAHWASMYAKFCKRMLETMSTDIKDENVKDKNGAPVVGGGLFRKYLLNRCQEEFERGWEVNLPAKPEGQAEEAVMLSDEYYIAAAAKRRGLGLIQFIGELYKLGMLTVRIMHECVMKLLNFEGLPDESAIESLVKLLRTVGGTMDANPSGHGMIGAYFERIEGLMKMDGLPSRLYYMLLDTVDLRSKGWRSKDEGKGPMTISELHEVEMRKAQQADLERQRSNARGGPGGRPPAGRGDARSFSQGGMQPPPDYHRNTVQMDDLKKLTRGARSANQGSGLSLGPSSMLGSRSNSGRKGLGPLSRGADDSGASSRTGTPPVKEKESAAHINAYR